MNSKAERDCWWTEQQKSVTQVWCHCCKCYFVISSTCTHFYRQQQQHTQSKGSEIPAPYSQLRSTQCQKGIYCKAHSHDRCIITVILSDSEWSWAARDELTNDSYQVKKSESVHSNGQSKTKPTAQLLEPRKDKVGQQVFDNTLSNTRWVFYI